MKAILELKLSAAVFQMIQSGIDKEQAQRYGKPEKQRCTNTQMTY